MIGTALLAVLVCVNFTSCGDDDDNPMENPNPDVVVPGGKKLVKMVSDEETRFYYDSEGRLIQTKNNWTEETGNGCETCDIFWEGDNVTVNVTQTLSDGYSNEFSYTFVLNDGLVQSCYRNNYDYDYFNYTYYYDSDKLVKQENAYMDCNIEWNGDKIVQISDNEETIKFTYGSTCKNGYFPFFVEYLTEEGFFDNIFQAQPQLLGMQTKQLPTSITTISGQDGVIETSNMSLTYEFDAEGYISKIICKKNGRGSSIKLYWE